MPSKKTKSAAAAGCLGAEDYVARSERIAWRIARRRGEVQKIRRSRERAKAMRAETKKAQIRDRVEHPFRIVKCVFGYVKVRFKGLAKNTMLCGLVGYDGQKGEIRRQRTSTMAGELAGWDTFLPCFLVPSGAPSKDDFDANELRPSPLNFHRELFVGLESAGASLPFEPQVVRLVLRLLLPVYISAHALDSTFTRIVLEGIAARIPKIVDSAQGRKRCSSVISASEATAHSVATRQSPPSMCHRGLKLRTFARSFRRKDCASLDAIAVLFE